MDLKTHSIKRPLYTKEEIEEAQESLALLVEIINRIMSLPFMSGMSALHLTCFLNAPPSTNTRWIKPRVIARHTGYEIKAVQTAIMYLERNGLVRRSSRLSMRSAYKSGCRRTVLGDTIITDIVTGRPFNIPMLLHMRERVLNIGDVLPDGYIVKGKAKRSSLKKLLQAIDNKEKA